MKLGMPKISMGKWGIKVLPILIIVLLRLVLNLAGVGDWRFWLGLALLVVGWVIGWWLCEIDHVMYAYACDPNSPTCSMVRTYIKNRQWRAAWEALEKTSGERFKLPIRNILTMLVVAGVGVWVVTSSGSLLGSGVVLGLGGRLLLELAMEVDYKKWYWVFARQFALVEHRGLLAALVVAYLYQIFIVVR